MAFQTTWYFSQLPEKVVDLIEKEVRDDSTIPEDSWVGGFIWHYVLRGNRENFTYNISHLDKNSIKYKVYNEGDFQSWHIDAKPREDGEDMVRKISFTVQLSDVCDYEGGNVQFMDEQGKKYYIPRHRGLIAVFDSSTLHRVQKITKGTRKALVGWCLGPKWN